MLIRIFKNQTSEAIVINDLGERTIPASGQLDLSDYQIDTLNNSDDLKLAITDDKLIVNDGIRDLNKEESLEILTWTFELETYNPDDYIYMLQVNTITAIFYSHTELVLLENELKNTFVDCYKGANKTSSYDQIQFTGKSIILSGSGGTSSTFEDFEDISDWINSASTTFVLSSSIVHEGSNSGKFTIQSNVQASKWSYVLRDIISPFENWSSYDTISIWVYGQGVGEKLRITIIDDNTATEFTTDDFVLSLGWQEINFDMSLANRSTIESVKIEIQKNYSGEVVVYFDDFRITTVGTYVSAGYAISNTTTVTADIKEIFYTDLVDLPDDTSYTVKLSLDGGTHWHQLDLEAEEKNQWVDITQWSEYLDFNNLKNLKTRIDLLTSDSSVTPTFDDYLVMWKLDI